MKNNFNYILIILVVIIILSGLGVIIYRDQLLLVLNQKSNIPDIANNEYLQEISIKETLDVSVLDNKNFSNLKDQEKKFNIENICELNSKINCSIGSSRPFDKIDHN